MKSVILYWLLPSLVFFMITNSILSLYTSGLFEERFENCSGPGTIQPINCDKHYSIPKVKQFWKFNAPTLCYVSPKQERDYNKIIYKCLTSTTWFEAQQQNYYIMIRFKWHSEPILGFQGGFPFIFMGFPFYCLAIIENSAGNCESHKFVQKINPRNLY